MDIRCGETTRVRNFHELSVPFKEALRPSPSKGLIGSYGVNSSEEQSSVMKFVDASFTAKKGEPRPKFLCSRVNMALVGWDKQTARRVGVGRVIFNAWLLARTLFSSSGSQIDLMFGV
jgi:hypothetical protein